MKQTSPIQTGAATVTVSAAAQGEPPAGKQPVENPMPVAVAASIEPLSRALLSAAEASVEREIHEISVVMLPVQHAAHLENFADHFGAGWLDSKKNKLRLQFHLVAAFSNAKTDELWLEVQGKKGKIALSPTRIASPAVGQRHAQLPWSAQSRFVVDEVFDLPRWARGAAKFELFAGVAGKQERIGVIYIGEVFKGAEKQSGSTPTMTQGGVAAVVNNGLAAMYEKLPPFAQVAVDRIVRMDKLFLATVVLPTLLSTLYFGLIASDIYVSESRFVVRSPQRQASTGLGALFQGAGFSRSQDDTYTVHDYIFSRDALKQLDTQLALNKEFSSGHVDIFSRFSALDWDDSFEALYHYYQKHVTLDMDSLSSISTLNVSAFSPEIAYQINERLLEMSETLVNQLNERGRQDMLAFANQEVLEAGRKSKEATLALARVQTGSARITGSGDALVNRLSEFQRLTLEKEFADKMLAMAMNSLEQARNDAQRKQLYLERIVQPSKPDVAVEPRRIRNILATLMLGLIAWGILTMLLAGVREHQD